MSTVASGVSIVPMPRLSDSMEEGTIVTWLVEDGAAVVAGEEIVEVETDKATMPYEAEADGVLHIVVPAGGTVEVGAPIAQIAPPGVAVSAPSAPDAEERSIAVDRQQQTTGAPAGGGAPERERSRVSASPLARRIARELNIDLATLVGSGPNGRVVKSDVLAAEPQAAPQSAQSEPAIAQGAPQTAQGAPAVAQSEPRIAQGAPAADSTLVPLTRVQQVIAKRMTESKQTAPDFVLDVEVDMGAAIAQRARFKELLAQAAAGAPADSPAAQVKPPSLGDFVVKACGVALREHPRVNGAFRGDAVELFDKVNIGVAVAVEGALLVPTVLDADQRTLGQIAADVRRLAAAARAGQLTPRELDGATFTVSNLGMFGVDAFTAVLNPPQAAILAVGAVRQRAVARDGQLALAHTMVARLTCDHRIVNGADGAAFLARVRELLETPELLAL